MCIFVTVLTRHVRGKTALKGYNEDKMLVELLCINCAQISFMCFVRCVCTPPDPDLHPHTSIHMYTASVGSTRGFMNEQIARGGRERRQDDLRMIKVDAREGRNRNVRVCVCVSVHVYNRSKNPGKVSSSSAGGSEMAMKTEE